MPKFQHLNLLSRTARYAVVALMVAVFSTGGFTLSAQTKQGEQKQKEVLTTLRGKVVLNSDVVKEIDWTTVKGTVGQLVALEQPTLPENWAKMTQAERVEWSTEFRESEAGKKLIEGNQKKLEGRFLEEFLIRDGGRFVVYDVPQGRFEMNIVARTTVDDKTYILRNLGQFEVGEVDEVKLGEMPLDVLRFLSMGEQAPNIVGTMDNGKELSLSQLKGKHVVLAFGMTGNPAFTQTTAMLKETVNKSEFKDKLSVLTVTVDEDTKAVAKFNKENGVNWYSMNLGKWDEQVLSEYGLKMVPSIWLLDPEGKIVLTGSQFLFESNRTQLPINKLVDEAISGRLTIGGEKPAEDEGASDDAAKDAKKDG